MQLKHLKSHAQDTQVTSQILSTNPESMKSYVIAEKYISMTKRCSSVRISKRKHCIRPFQTLEIGPLRTWRGLFSRLAP